LIRVGRKGEDMMFGREWTNCKINFQCMLTREMKIGDDKMLQKDLANVKFSAVNFEFSNQLSLTKSRKRGEDMMMLHAEGSGRH
jgi:hypothetical protein